MALLFVLYSFNDSVAMRLTQCKHFKRYLLKVAKP